MKISEPNSSLDTLNYWAPLTSQVEAQDNETNENIKKVRFKLPISHRETNGWQYQKMESMRHRNQHKNSSMKRRRRVNGGGFTFQKIKQGIMDGTIPSACADT